MTLLYVIAFYLAGAFSAKHDEKDGDLLSRKSGIVVWGITALFFFVFLLFGVAGTPAAWTTLFIAIGYHLTAIHIVNNRGIDESHTRNHSSN